MENKFKCYICGQGFERPHKHRTETESYHIKGCEIKQIENIISKGNIDAFDKMKYIDKLEHIFHVSSLGARTDPINKYWKRMIKCKKLIERLEGD